MTAEAEVLNKILDTLQVLNKKFDQFILHKSPVGAGCLDAASILNLPDHLRKSALIVLTNGRVTAMDVAAETKRCRAVESGYLNILVTMGYLKKERGSRIVHFFVNQDN